MKSSAKKVELASVDDLFSTEESRADAQRERVLEIPLSELHPFKNHPFKVKDDESMMETADSIRQYGVLVPAIARPDPEGGYELVTTTMPGLQVYSGNFLTDRIGKYGAAYHKRDAICLETQYYPNAMACEIFEKPILRAGDLYHHTTSFAFSIR